MTPTASDPKSFTLPRLRTTIRGSQGAYWDVRFFPYLTARDDPAVFAVVSHFEVLICEVTNEEDAGLRILATHARESRRIGEDYMLNACTWCSLDQEDGQPLLAVAGDNGHIQIIEAFSGDLLSTLAYHGLGVINDLTTHPLYPWIIASASMDGSIRIWDLRRAGSKTQSTCIVLCGHNLAHEAGLLSIHWHDTGRYIVSSGFDHKICVWTIPDLSTDSSFWQEICKEKRKRSSDELRVIQYPHFITSAIHTDYVDKVMFWGDLILSKAAGNQDREGKIVLWAMTGFHSAQPPPTSDTAPKTQEHLETRNGFMRKPRVAIDDDVFNGIDARYREVAPYTRYLEFHCPYSKSFYIRFGMLQPSRLFPELHPVLTAGNTSSQIRHWDLEQFIVGHNGGENHPEALSKHAQMQKGIARRKIKSAASFEDDISPSSSRASSTAFTPSDMREPSTEATSLSSDQLRPPNGEGIRPDRKRFPLHDPNLLLKEHKKNEISDLKAERKWFTTRAVDWSFCGKWCVVVGESEGTAVMVLLDRWT
ncbi:hypothetical protein H2198_002120 [Neophaeococcomyces mojaviensis]|uniref:Uncharacterized protein n=1 Tax=Neophaeococcomyces mojaviensis TaxID=3383035 RepID=A0ACC3AF32_9EURO|nr:hypothetical protein H2198_002120 [Knufia sp. JES_112]